MLLLTLCLWWYCCFHHKLPCSCPLQTTDDHLSNPCTGSFPIMKGGVAVATEKTLVETQDVLMLRVKPPHSQPWQDNRPQHMLPLTPKPDSDDNHWKHLYSLRHKERHSLDGEAMAAGDLRASLPRANIPSLLKHLLPCGFADFV